MWLGGGSRSPPTRRPSVGDLPLKGGGKEAGRFFTVDRARIYTLPDEPPAIAVAAAGPRAAELAGRVGDALVATSPDEELISAFGQMAQGVDDNPERVSSFYITADAAQLVLAALVSLRQSAIASERLPQVNRRSQRRARPGASEPWSADRPCIDGNTGQRPFAGSNTYDGQAWHT